MSDIESFQNDAQIVLTDTGSLTDAEATGRWIKGQPVEVDR